MNKKSTTTRKPTKKVNHDIDFKDSGKMKNPDDKFCRDYEHPKTNDPSWYDQYGLMSSAANVSMYNPTGIKVDLPTDIYKQNLGSHTHGFTPALFRIPGIMTFDTAFGPGIADDVNAAINVAAQSIYTYVRHWNSGAANYEKADLMQYIMLVESAWVMYWQGVRAYSAMNAVNTLNRYVPRFVTEALGFDYDDLTSKLTLFRSILDQFAVRISRFVIPNDLTYAKRLDYLFSNIFVDSMSAKSQFYIYNPAGYYEFALEGDSDPHPGAGYLKWNWFNTYAGTEPNQHAPWTVDQYQTMLSAIAENLEDQEDFGIMSGDILKAYPNNAVKSVGNVPADLVMQPIYDQYALEQIHNATITGYPVVKDVTDNEVLHNWNVRQNPEINGGELIYNPLIQLTAIIPASQNPVYGKRIIDFHRDGITYLDVTEATRSMAVLKPCVDSGNQSEGYAQIRATGAETIVKGRVFTINMNGEISESPIYTENDFNTSDDDSVTEIVSAAATFIARLANVSQFDYAPHTFLLTSLWEMTNADLDLEGIALFSDIDNYSVIDPEVVNNIHSAALLSLFKINL
nr:putative capsid protein [Chicken picobirnavirus]